MAPSSQDSTKKFQFQINSWSNKPIKNASFLTFRVRFHKRDFKVLQQSNCLWLTNRFLQAICEYRSPIKNSSFVTFMAKLVSYLTTIIRLYQNCKTMLSIFRKRFLSRLSWMSTKVYEKANGTLLPRLVRPPAPRLVRPCKGKQSKLSFGRLDIFGSNWLFKFAWNFLRKCILTSD